MSRPVTVTIPHTLGKDEARRRIETGFGQMRRQKLSGQLDVRDDAVQIQIDLPEVLAALADKITGKLKEEGQKLLEKK